MHFKLLIRVSVIVLEKYFPVWVQLPALWALRMRWLHIQTGCTDLCTQVGGWERIRCIQFSSWLLQAGDLHGVWPRQAIRVTLMLNIGELHHYKQAGNEKWVAVQFSSIYFWWPAGNAMHISLSLTSLQTPKSFEHITCIVVYLYRIPSYTCLHFYTLIWFDSMCIFELLRHRVQAQWSSKTRWRDRCTRLGAPVGYCGRANGLRWFGRRPELFVAWLHVQLSNCH